MTTRTPGDQIGPALPDSGARSTVVLAINGVVREVVGAAAFGTLSEYLREQLRLTGTKIVCSEGDCGACSVLVGEPAEEGFEYRSIDSCIAFVYQLDGCHIITVDGLSTAKNAQDPGALHPVQRAMADNYGSQCGFCTPGFVVAIADHVEKVRCGETTDSPNQVGTALSGNLCRCTGYVQILQAVEAVDPDLVPPLSDLFDEKPLLEALNKSSAEPLRLEHEGYCVEVPRTESQVLAARATNPQARVVAGATDLGVRFNKGQLETADLLHLRHDLENFNQVYLDEDTEEIVLGAAVRWSDALPLVDSHAPEFAQILRRFGGPQIRNMGTVGGNIMNASPIADALPFLFVSDARLQLASREGCREVAIADFYQGYKAFDLKPQELLQSVRFKIANRSRNEQVHLFKASRRRDLDISTFTAGLWLAVADGAVVTARVAYGGVGPTVVRLNEVEDFLSQQPLTRSTFEQAGELAARAIKPISDLRGASSYRRLLAKNVMLRFAEQPDVAGDR